jgi:hypothetical protein
MYNFSGRTEVEACMKRLFKLLSLLTQSIEQIQHCLPVSLSSLATPFQEGSMDYRTNSHRRILELVKCSDDARNANNLREYREELFSIFLFKLWACIVDAFWVQKNEFPTSCIKRSLSIMYEVKLFRIMLLVVLSKFEKNFNRAFKKLLKY